MSNISRCRYASRVPFGSLVLSSIARPSALSWNIVAAVLLADSQEFTDDLHPGLSSAFLRAP